MKKHILDFLLDNYEVISAGLIGGLLANVLCVIIAHG